MNSQSTFDELRNCTDQWVSSLVPANYLRKLQLQMPRRGDYKIIRDALHGYQILEPHEYLILDHPLMQRLRRIHQTALAYLVYPTANHTRFDHSLGCAKVAQNIGNRLIGGDKTRVRELRLAALLHDVGHTFFSHLSETIMQSHFRRDYIALKKAPDFRQLDLSLSEMMSYLIVTSKLFAEFLDKIVHHYHPNLDLDNVAKIIIHNPSDNLVSCQPNK